MEGSERNADAAVTIAGQGLAGTCLAWQLWKRGGGYLIVDDGAGGSSRVAAGLINPVTGKNFEPSARIGAFLPEAVDFYQEIGEQLGECFWHPLPVLRLAETEREWEKMKSKAARPDVAAWLADSDQTVHVDGWAGALVLTGGGRLDTRRFIEASRDFFMKHGIHRQGTLEHDAADTARIWCEGAAGLMQGRYGPHRCAKGEILTVSADGWDQSQIRIGAGGWLVPLGGGLFKAGSTYEWDVLDNDATADGRNRIMKIATRLGGGDFEVVSHEAGIRPILRRSEPLIGPLGDGDWMFNGLGSKGSLYAPGMARRLARWLIDGTEPEAELVFRNITANG